MVDLGITGVYLYPDVLVPVVVRAVYRLAVVERIEHRFVVRIARDIPRRILEVDQDLTDICLDRYVKSSNDRWIQTRKIDTSNAVSIYPGYTREYERAFEPGEVVPLLKVRLEHKPAHLMPGERDARPD